jgi:hypothetical protein
MRVTMLVSAVLISLLLGNDGRGEAPSAASVEERERPRVRMSVGLGGMLGFTQLSYIGPVLRLEGGVMMNDRLGLSATADISTRIDMHSIGGGVALTWAGLEWLSLSAGLSITYLGAIDRYDYPAVLTFLVPLRADLVFLVRSLQTVPRRSPVVSLTLAPGLSRVARSSEWVPEPVGSIGPALLIGLSLAYAVW